VVLRVHLDTFGLHGRCVEHHPIGLDVGGADCLDHPLEVLKGVVETAEEVEVLRGPGQRRLPDIEHQRALQDEALAVIGPRQAVEEPLHRVVLEQLLKRTIGGPRLVLQARMHRGREVRDVLGRHGITSR
jgi:hypothetical protein